MNTLKTKVSPPDFLIHSSAPAVKKTRVDLLPAQAMHDMGLVMAYGEDIYPISGWKDKSISEHLAAANRHLNSWQRGWREDRDSGLSHLAHAACRLMFIIEQEYYDQLDGTVDFGGVAPNGDPDKTVGFYHSGSLEEDL
jgi:hypothetical protein